MATVDDDDEALTWAGDTDRLGSRVEPAPTAAPAATDEPVPVRSRRDTALIGVYGVFAGVYLVFTVLWLLGVQYVRGNDSTLLAAIMFQFGEFLAIISCPIWFAAVWYLTKTARPFVRVLWLVAGVALLVPWPFFLGLAR
ncbi:hypothetical protein CLV46_0863 [Diaminobutyricimonas aerilata]|uniref:DNA polymerase III subunit gamma/tau n=1 Tax=Diaminobutyricimonas aerilata TaxID=1162967 RepID=A0A2M9CHG9_9MICO|nr:hypothetical protein [Diaminobutyricimonas aerilata]PJJ71320.1 hypothetical protein CLV46_0863 [Diaminobutyricimonas aerilata]